MLHSLDNTTVPGILRWVWSGVWSEPVLLGGSELNDLHWTAPPLCPLQAVLGSLGGVELLFPISRVKNGNSVTTLRLTCFDD